jgi:hypothetical protein
MKCTYFGSRKALTFGIGYGPCRVDFRILALDQGPPLAAGLTSGQKAMLDHGQLRCAAGDISMLTFRRPNQSPIYQKAIAILIWLAFAAAGIGALYGLSFLAGD